MCIWKWSFIFIFISKCYVVIPKTIPRCHSKWMFCQVKWVVLAALCVSALSVTHYTCDILHNSNFKLLLLTKWHCWKHDSHRLYAKNFSRSVLCHESVPVKPFYRLSLTSVLFKQSFSSLMSLWSAFDLYVLRLFFSALLQSNFLSAVIVFISVWKKAPYVIFESSVISHVCTGL